MSHLAEHRPSMHVGVMPPQLVHAAPPVPQVASVLSTHELLTQQPCGQLLLVHKQRPLTHSRLFGQPSAHSATSCTPDAATQTLAGPHTSPPAQSLSTAHRAPSLAVQPSGSK